MLSHAMPILLINSVYLLISWLLQADFYLDDEILLTTTTNKIHIEKTKQKI